MKIFFDTEFIEDGKTIDMISIGAVKENGETFYAISNEFNAENASTWVKENVLDKLTPSELEKYSAPKKEIAEEFVKFCGKNPEFWAYYADYDWVLLCQLYGTMMDLPEAFPKFCMDIKQLQVHKGNPELPTQESGEHRAIDDAKWNQLVYNYLNNV